MNVLKIAIIMLILIISLGATSATEDFNNDLR